MDPMIDPDKTKRQHAPWPWKPDVHIQAFVPASLLAINHSPAIILPTPALGGINFEHYTTTFMASGFRPSPREPLLPRMQESIQNLIKTPVLENYKPCLENFLALDLEAQSQEIRAYDLFGAPFKIQDLTQQNYSLRISGLRDGTPTVRYGDTFMLRQLLMDPATKMPHGMSKWLAPGGGRDKSQPAPGFTGYQISAIVIGVDRKRETVIFHAPGMLNSNLVCNVSFVVQARAIERLQAAVASVAKSLPPSETRTGEETSWLQCMLFPEDRFGVNQQELPSAVFSQTWRDQGLNYEQKKAVDAVQFRKAGRLPYLIFGPPGTGKTKTLCEIIVQLGRDDPNFLGSILLCAPSNQAADTLADRLRVHFDPKAMLRLNDSSRTFAEVPNALLPYCFVDGDIFNLPPLPVLMKYRVVVTTCQDADILVQARVTNQDIVTLQGNMTATFNPFHFQQGQLSLDYPLHWTALIMDEAAQATEPETLIPLSVVSPPTSNKLTQEPIFVMAGDEHQLNPRTYDRSTALHVSLFERLSKTTPFHSHPLARKNMSRSSHYPMLRPPFANLIRNYRSHPAILAVPSSLFYANTLIPEATHVGDLQSWSGWHGQWPVLFACNDGMDDCEDVKSVGGGWYNTSEATKAIAFAGSLLKSGMISIQRNICIMSPFPSQVRLLRDKARALNFWDLNIGPMEAFQGLESQFVIICTTRTRRRFLETDEPRGIGIVHDEKKFNVAITRAKQGLIVIGNPWVLETSLCWLAFLHFCWRNSLWHKELKPDPRMRELEESLVNEWQPSHELDAEGHGIIPKISGLEAALTYKELGKWQGSKAAKRFMSGEGSLDDAMWNLGLQAEEDVRNHALGSTDYLDNPDKSDNSGDG